MEFYHRGQEWYERRMIQIVKSVKRIVKEYWLNLRRRSRYTSTIDVRRKNLIEESRTEIRIILMGVPEYGNLGDIAISYATANFIREFFPEYTFWRFTENQIRYDLKKIKKVVTDTDLLLLQGGGNLNDLYKDQNAVRARIFKHFPDNPILLLPQSCIFNDTEAGELRKIRRQFNSHSKLRLFARDPISMKRMQHYFSNEVRLAPDMVLSLKRRKKTKEKTGKIGICIRHDQESGLGASVLDEITEYINKIGKEPLFINTVIPDTVEVNKQEIFLEAVWETFASCDAVITDRLHGVIFSYIMDTPCMAINTNNDKVVGICRWLEDCDWIVLSRTPDLLESDIKQLLQSIDSRVDFENEKVLSEFYPLIKDIDHFLISSE